MKGKVSFYYDMPNLAKVRSRVENPSREFTSGYREILNEAIVAVLNRSTVELRAELIKRTAELDLPFKNDAHKAQVTNLINNFFDVLFAGTNQELEDMMDVLGEPAEIVADVLDDMAQGPGNDTEEVLEGEPTEIKDSFDDEFEL